MAKPSPTYAQLLSKLKRENERRRERASHSSYSELKKRYRELQEENERLAESVRVSAEMREEFAGMCRLLARHGHRANAWEEAALLLFQMAVDVDEDAAERIYAEAKREAE